MPRRVQGPDGKVHEFPDDATDAEISAALDATPKKARTWGDVAADFLPTVGGTIGSLEGGTIGAAVGGAAGAGYRQLAQHATELPGALADIAHNVVEQPGATLRGFAQGAGQGAVDAGTQAAIQGGANLVGNAVVAGARNLAPALMQSALKPGIKSTLAAVKGGTTPPVVQTLLDEGINVTPGGIEKLNGIIGATNADIKSAINSLTGGIRPLAVTSRLSETARKFANQVNPQADLNAISDVGQNFLEAHGAQDLAPQAAQSLKTGTYAALKDKAYGEVKGATIEAEKALARGLKEEIAAEAQKSGIDLTAKNAREGAAITARDAIAKRVAMVGNRDPAGLAWLAHSPVTFMMAVMERSPVVKSMLARGLYQSAAKASGMPAEALRWAVGAIASAQDEEQ
jgi:hypothetical protein